MNKVNIIFRADGSSQTGLGHLIRCAALAEMLVSDFNVRLVSRECPESLIPRLLISFDEVTLLPESDQTVEAVEEFLQHVEQLPEAPKIIVLDGYGFNTAYQRKIKGAGYYLVCIDDIHASHFVADMIINHAPSATAHSYSLEAYTTLAFGLRFALLSPPFLRIARSPHDNKNPQEIFICLGGADPDNGTLGVVKRLFAMGCSNPLTIVVGSAYKFFEELQLYLNSSSLQFRVIRGADPQEMVTFMQASRVGITSPSTVSLEYLCAGRDLYLVQIADNQAEIYEALLQLKLARDVTSLDLSDTSVNRPRPKKPIDGFQSYRLLALFKNYDISYRNATSDDSALYLAWANDSSVRKQSFNTEIIRAADHEEWFTRQLVSLNTKMLIFERNNVAVGQVRLTITESFATVSYSVAMEARGMGLGLAMLLHAESYLKRHQPSISEIRGFVKVDNTASRKIFDRLGYQSVESDEYPDALKYYCNDF